MTIEERCDHYMIEHLGRLVHSDNIEVYRCISSSKHRNLYCGHLLSPYTMGGTLDIENYKPTKNRFILRYEPHECMNPSRAIGLT